MSFVVVPAKAGAVEYVAARRDVAVAAGHARAAGAPIASLERKHDKEGEGRRDHLRVLVFAGCAIAGGGSLRLRRHPIDPSDWLGAIPIASIF